MERRGSRLRRSGARTEESGAGKTRKVTALAPQQRNRERVNVFLDGRFAFGLAAIVAARLKIGQPLGDAEIERLKAVDAAEEAYNKAIGYLSYRPRSRAELERYLQGKKLSPETTAQVLERLERLSLVNDGEFARYWVENREQFAPRGRYALRAELRRKGVTDGSVEEALTGVDETASAYEAARKKAARMQGLDHATFGRRLGGFLGRRGFGYDVVKEVVERLWRERGDKAGEEVDSD